MQQPASTLEGRYGRRSARPRPALVAAILALVTAFLGWVVWAALGAASGRTPAQVTAFRVVSDREISVRVSAVDDRSDRFACRVRALDATREVVGVATVVLHPTGAEGRERWVSLRTRDRAVTATLGECAGRGRG